MRVTLVNSLYPPNIVGGAELSTEILANALARQGLDVSVVTLGNQRRVSKELVNGVTVYRCPLRNLYWPFEGTAPALLKPAWHALDTINRRAMKDVAEIIALERPDIVHTANLAGFSVSAWKAAEQAGFPVIHTIRDYYLLCARSTMHKGGRNCEKICWECRAFSKPRQWNSRTPQAVVGISDFILRRHLDFGFFKNAKAKRVIYNAFQDAPALPPRKERGDGIVRFGYLGRLEPAKGLDLLMASLKSMPAVGWRFVIAGRGPEDYLQKLRPMLEAPQVDYLGWSDPAAFFSQIDALVVPSIWHEPFGRTVVEAYSHGVPVIASDRGGIPEIVEDGTTGWLFDPSDVASLTAALQRFIDGRQNLAELHKACLLKSQEFHPDVTAKEYIRAYEDLLGVTQSVPAGQ